MWARAYCFSYRIFDFCQFRPPTSFCITPSNYHTPWMPAALNCLMYLISEFMLPHVKRNISVCPLTLRMSLSTISTFYHRRHVIQYLTNSLAIASWFIFNIVTLNTCTNQHRHLVTCLEFHVPRISASISLRWRHNGPNGVSNHQPGDCLLNRLFSRRSKKASKLRVMAFVSIWWRHHGNYINIWSKWILICNSQV